jgi:hypothetical protein
VRSGHLHGKSDSQLKLQVAVVVNFLVKEEINSFNQVMKMIVSHFQNLQARHFGLKFNKFMDSLQANPCAFNL